jgi:hypothetical protein
MAAIEASPVPKKSTGFELSPVFGSVLFVFDTPVDVRVRPFELLPVDLLPDEPLELLPDDPDELPLFELPDEPDELLPDELPDEPDEPLPDEPDDLPCPLSLTLVPTLSVSPII